MPTRQTTDAMAIKFFPDTIILSEVYHLEGLSNQIEWLTIT